MIELEKTYLVKYIPEDLKDSVFKEIIDVYIPKETEHPVIRIRKNGDRFEMTKKYPIHGNDSSCQQEETIILTEAEFNFLNQLTGKRVCKLRYCYNYNGRIAEFDIFQDLLEGLVLIDFEFETIEEKNSFEMPEFCLVEVTQEKFLAGGMICGKSYKDIKSNLEKFNYKRLELTKKYLND